MKANYHIHTRVIHFSAPVGFGITKWPGFSLLTGTPLELRVRLFFLIKELCYSPSRIMRE